VLRSSLNFGTFLQLLGDYNIAVELRSNSYIRYEQNDFWLEFTNGGLRADDSSINTVPTFNPIYIPAERLFFATFSQSILGLLSNNIALPKSLVDFGARFEVARVQLRSKPVDFLGISYEYDGRTDWILVNPSLKIRLSEASSGIQTVLPLFLVVQFFTAFKERGDNLFVIEEPELSLYPRTQKDLVEWLVARIQTAQDKLVLTTHSPYLLTALDNLIQAYNVVKLNPAALEKVRALVPASHWIDFEQLSCYYFDKGTCHSTLDSEMSSIGPSNIDDVSTSLSETFEQLLALKYPA
jgi:hypothetical protein